MVGVSSGIAGGHVQSLADRWQGSCSLVEGMGGNSRGSLKREDSAGSKSTGKELAVGRQLNKGQ